MNSILIDVSDCAIMAKFNVMSSCLVRERMVYFRSRVARKVFNSSLAKCWFATVFPIFSNFTATCVLVFTAGQASQPLTRAEHAPTCLALQSSVLTRAADWLDWHTAQYCALLLLLLLSPAVPSPFSPLWFPFSLQLLMLLFSLFAGHRTKTTLKRHNSSASTAADLFKFQEF